MLGALAYRHCSPAPIPDVRGCDHVTGLRGMGCRWGQSGGDGLGMGGLPGNILGVERGRSVYTLRQASRCPWRMSRGGRCRW